MAIDLSPIEKSKLKAFVKDDIYDLLMKLVYERVAQWNTDRPSGTNAFETLRAMHIRDGKVDGLTEFFSDLEKNGFD